MARRGPRLVLASDKGVLSADAAAELGPGAVLGVLSPASVDGAVPDAARALARERRARIVPLAASTVGLDAVIATAATCAGATIAAASRAQRVTVSPLAVAHAVGAHFGRAHAAHADLAADRARRAFESTLEAVVAGESGAQN
jgi:uncharacterized membrane protein